MSPTEGRAPAAKRQPRLSRLAGGAAWVAGGLFVAQVLGYGFNLVAARSLGPADYGALAALLGVVLIANTVGLGLQTVVAREVARRADQPTPGLSALRFGVLAGGAVTGALLLLTPVLVWLLHLPDVASLLLLAVAMLPITVAGAQIGLAQGHRDYRRTGVLYAVVTGGRAVGGVAGTLATGTLSGAMVGFATGAIVGAAFGLLLVRPFVQAQSRWPGLAGETGHVVHALLAFFVLTNVDVLLARHYLPAEDAGMYGVGVLLAKVAFFLPQFVIVVAFPRMAATEGRRPTVIALALTVAIGAPLTIASLVAGRLLVTVAGGAQYTALSGSAWLFVAFGSLLALLQVLLLSRLARVDRRAVLAVWSTTAVLVAGVAARFHDSVHEIVGWACVTASLALAVGVAAVLRRPATTRLHEARG